VEFSEPLMLCFFASYISGYRQPSIADREENLSLQGDFEIRVGKSCGECSGRRLEGENKKVLAFLSQHLLRGGRSIRGDLIGISAAKPQILT